MLEKPQKEVIITPQAEEARGGTTRAMMRDGVQQEGCLGAVVAIEGRPFLQPGLGKKGTRE